MRTFLRGRVRPRQTFVLLVAVALALGVLGSASAAQVLTVCPSGCQYTTVAAALAAAADGDTIAIGQGTYAGGFTIDKSVSFLGAGATQTTISGGSPVITLPAQTLSVSISSVTITGGTGPGIYAQGSYDTPYATLVVSDSTVSGNAGTGIGGWENGTILRSRIVDNGGTGVGGGNWTIDRSTISGNGAQGVAISRRAGARISDSTISNNAGTGLYAVGGISVENSMISGNTAQFGGGIYVAGFEGGMSLTNSTLAKNTASGAGGGGLVDSAGGLRLSNVKVVGNAAPQGGGLFLSPGAGLLVDQSVIVANAATGGLGSGGGIFISDYAVTVFTGTQIVGNKPDNCVGC